MAKWLLIALLAVTLGGCVTDRSQLPLALAPAIPRRRPVLAMPGRLLSATARCSSSRAQLQTHNRLTP